MSLDEIVAVTLKFPVRVSVVFFKGVYVKAVVMSEADNERIAVNGLVPCLFKVNTLVFAAASEKAMLETKLLVSVEVMVSEVAVEDNETLVPALKLVGPNGT